ncbi:hypothetical protein [Nocardia bhagyanarayanae]|uniref:Uncharacterized protein n=1 Tax=Nocardia bhagyanarayanae TaxID=1215925 RepID=A0A543EY02_9NOCA|nr:hypothetical protein [Nocardia bhagyanarayanae]TQM26451.1 hypothetical protein FB390_6648 [Nocardia bhagyanarayanae]
MSNCDHKSCAKEDFEEHLGKLAAAAFLDDEELIRVCQNERVGPVVDYRSPLNAVEVKALKTRDLERLRGAYRKQTDSGLLIEVRELEKTWFVTLDGSAAAGERSQYLGAPSVRSLADKLGPLLVELEAQGVDDYYAAGWRLGGQVAALVHGGSCSVAEIPGVGPGIFLAALQYGHSRPHSLDRAVRDRVQDWLDSDSSKMVASFDGEDGLRCGVLVLPPAGVGFTMMRSLSEDFPDPTSLPTEPLTLPKGLDTLIIVAGNHAMRFTPPDLWTRMVLHP